MYTREVRFDFSNSEFHWLSFFQPLQLLPTPNPISLRVCPLTNFSLFCVYMRQQRPRELADKIKLEKKNPLSTFCFFFVLLSKKKKISNQSNEIVVVVVCLYSISPVCAFQR